jgi:carbon monoxide dehydrogenase subunit G
MQVTYRGEGRFVVLDRMQGRAVLEASGREVRGNGAARTSVTVQLLESGTDQTRVQVETDLHITGRPAQFGRGVVGDVSDRLLSAFVECLREEISRGTAEDTQEDS